MDDFDRATDLASRAAKVFQPRSPITTKELFAGRWDQLMDVTDAVHQPGLHVVIFGERGVGKTSLAATHLAASDCLWVCCRCFLNFASGNAHQRKQVA